MIGLPFTVSCLPHALRSALSAMRQGDTPIRILRPLILYLRFTPVCTMVAGRNPPAHPLIQRSIEAPCSPPAADRESLKCKVLIHFIVVRSLTPQPR
jgi:hypothetical protein